MTYKGILNISFVEDKWHSVGTGSSATTLISLNVELGPFCSHYPHPPSYMHERKDS